MICATCGIEWQGRTPSKQCPRCQTDPTFTKNDLAEAPPMPSAEIEALFVQLRQFGWDKDKQ